MYVIMKRQTFYEGAKNPGDVVKVDDITAARWIKNKIAEYRDVEVAEEDILEATVAPEANEVQEVDAEDAAVASYDNLSAKELYQACIDNGLEVEMKKPRAYYLEMLKAE